jgi:glycosyltransferase involved in cell wall biosynthesis
VTPISRKLPLISCIMPTVNRPVFVAKSIEYFHAQDYVNKELVIVDEGIDTTMIRTLKERDVHIVTVGSDTRLSLGAKFNLGCSLAQGDIICHWDDDDYFAPHRLTHQAQPILEGVADIVGLEMDIVFNIIDWTAWKCSPALHQEIFYGGVVTGAIMYKKSVWGMNAAHPNKTIGEDADFLRHLRLFGAKLASLPNNGSFIYIRHGDTWPLPPHYHPHMHEWQQVDVKSILPEKELAFYSTLRNKE